jgi:hypothetical protein
MSPPRTMWSAASGTLKGPTAQALDSLPSWPKEAPTTDRVPERASRYAPDGSAWPRLDVPVGDRGGLRRLGIAIERSCGHWRPITGSSRLSGEQTSAGAGRPSTLHDVAGRQPTKALVRACADTVPLSAAVSVETMSVPSPHSNAEGPITLDRRGAPDDPERADVGGREGRI